MATSRATCVFPLPLSLLLLFFFVAFHQAHLSLAADTISANQSLTGNQNITSKGGKFALGFFNLPGGSPNRYYAGIWYHKIPQFTPVWVANQEIPVADPYTSELKISDDGNLVLLNQFKDIIWSTNVTVSSNSSVAVILDTGNLQLRDESNSSRFFWQSFDHLTDTLLPGARLGFNKVTNQNQYMTSWKNKVDPTPGIFSLVLDPDGTDQYLMFWNMSKAYWASGPWIDRSFTGIPEMNFNYISNAPGRNLNDIYEFRYVKSDEGKIFEFIVKNDNVTTRVLTDPYTGQIQMLTWVENTNSWMLFWSEPRQQCSAYALCGPFGSCNEISLPFCNCVKGFRVKFQTDWDLGDRTGGCVRRTPLQCGRSSSPNSEKDGFYVMSNVRLPDNPRALAAVGNDNDCELACLKNCSCNAYTYNSSGCFVWHGDLLNLQEQYNQSDASTLYLRLAASELRSSKNKKGVVTWVIVSAAVVAIGACFALTWVTIWRRRSKRMIHKSKAVGGSLRLFSYSELKHATRNFSEKLGEGGFGSVFKGSFPDSTIIAVKKLEGFHQGEKQFRTEVSTIGTIQHVNLVRLLGFCSEGSKKLLVYEFMPRGSLDAQLFHSTSMVLDWKTRYQIAVGTARGLAYLHEHCRDCIIHCDIKPENILLDASFAPKVADFGLAKLVGRDFSRVLTTLRGTRGYLAPEWITGVAITARADVYSYGMMLFEIISGRRNLDQTRDGGIGYFPKLVASKLITGDVENLLDPRLGSDADLEELERVCKVACWCIQDDESSRPTMGVVVQVLEGFLDVNMPPVPRSLLLAESSEDINFYYDSSSHQSSQTGSSASVISQTKSIKSSTSGA